MIHRHLKISNETPVEDLPSAALVDLLDRGDLADWAPLARAIAANPDGPLAERVLQLVDAYPMYGTSPLWRAWIDRRRAAVDGDPERPAPLRLAELRRRCGLTQAELAARMGTTQSDLSKLERRGDVRCSSLRAFVRALGAELRLAAVFAEREEIALRL